MKRPILWLGLLALPIITLASEPVCIYSDRLLRCTDGAGGYYAMAQQGKDLLLRGQEGASGIYWVQTNSEYGRLQFFSGLSSDGKVWSGISRRFGWNQISRFSTSDGQNNRLSCNRISGCEYGEPQ